MTNAPTTLGPLCQGIQHDLKSFLQGEFQTNVERRGQIKGHLFACEDCTVALAELMVEESDRLAETVGVTTKEAMPSFEILKVLGVIAKQGTYYWEKLKQFAEQDWTWAKKEMSHLTSNFQETLQAALFFEERGNVAYAHLGETTSPTQIKTIGAKLRDAAGQFMGQDMTMEILTPPTVTTEGQFVLRLRSNDRTLEGLLAQCFLKTLGHTQIAFEGTVTKESEGQGVELTIQVDDLPKGEKIVELPLDYLALEFVQECPTFPEKNINEDTSNLDWEMPENSWLSEWNESIDKTRLTGLLTKLQQAFEVAPGFQLREKVIEEMILTFIGSPFLNIRGKRVEIFKALMETRMFSIVRHSEHENASAFPMKREQEISYKLRWEITPQYIINRFWGIPLDGGLNVQFEGGIVPRANSGVSALIMGDSGVGKSMMAIHMAAFFASQGYSAVYVTTGGDVGLFIEKLSILGYIPESPAPEEGIWIFYRGERKFALEIRNFLIGQVAIQPPLRQKKEKQGILTFLKVTPGYDELNQQEILENFQLISKGITGECCLVFDCIGEILQKIKEPLSYFFKKLFQLNPLQIGLFISALDSKSPIIQQAKEKADILIHLTKEIRGKGVLDRALTILRSSTQRCNMGKHFFSIDRPEGFVVFPSPLTLSHIWDRRMKYKEQQSFESWKLDETFEFDSIIRNDIRRGSPILLRGQGATHRFPIGLSFLASIIKDDPKAQVILLSLRDNRTSIIQTIHNYPQLFPLLSDDGNDFNARVNVGYLPPNRFGPERILHWARKVLANHQTTDQRVRRVLFSNLSQFRNSSFFEEDVAFTRALVLLFKKSDVTSLFIDTVDEPSRGIPEGFEAVLRTFDNDDGRGPQIKMEYTARCNATHDPYQIKSEEADRTGNPNISGNFRILRLISLSGGPHGTLATQPTDEQERASLND